MKNYIYDGSFEGLLCCVYASYYDEAAASISAQESCQTALFAQIEEVATDWEKARKVYEAVEKKISPYDLRRIYKVFLSCGEDKEMKILRYIQKGFKYGRKISNLHGDPVVFEVQTLERKVGAEVHRLYGLVRFRELAGGIMYSAIEPDNDVIELMAEHFTKRFQSAPFILHDKKRDKAVAAGDGSWYITDFTSRDIGLQSSAENEYQRLWKTYFEHIAIKERKNSRCQRSFMPARYWKNIVEMQPPQANGE